MDTVEWLTDGATDKLTLVLDPTKGQMTLKESDPSQTKHIKSYARPEGKSDKVLSKIATKSKDITFDAHENLAQYFDCLVAIDTDTKTCDAESISIVTACITLAHKNPHQKQIPFDHLCTFIIANLSKDENAEAMGWFLVLKNKIKKSYFKKRRLGVIADYNQNSHDAINAQKKSIYGGYLLPKNYSLIYASDAAVDSLANAMVRKCDKINEQIYNHLKKDISRLIARAQTPVPKSSSATYIEVSAKRS